MKEFKLSSHCVTIGREMDFNEENRSDMECKQMADVLLGDSVWRA